MWVYNVVFIIILFEGLWFAEFKSVDSHCMLAREIINRYISRPPEPNQVVNLCRGNGGSESIDCCNEGPLKNIVSIGAFEFTKHWRIFWLNISQNLREDAHYLKGSLKLTLQSFHHLFVNSYGYNYDQNKDFVEAFFRELESYMLGNRQNIASLVDDFFDGLLIRALRVMLFVKTERDSIVADCVASKLRPMKPFDQAPEIIRAMATRAFPPSRILRNGLLLGDRVVQVLSKVAVNDSCINEWIKLRYCNLCSGVIQPLICRHSCFSRLSTCFLLWTAFDKYWLSFIDQIVRVAERLKNSKIFPQVIRPLQIHISDAIMNLQTILFRLDQSDEFFNDCLLENSKEHQSFLPRTDYRQRRQQEFVFVDHDVVSQDYKHPYVYGNYDMLKSWADSIHNKYLPVRKPFSTIIKYFCSEDLLRVSKENNDYLCWTGDRLIPTSNITVNLIENESFLKIHPMAVRVIKDLQYITEIMQSVIQNNSDPNYVPIEGENRIQSIDNITVFLPLPSYPTTNPGSNLTTLSYLESLSKIHSPSLPNHVKKPFQFDENHIKTSRFSIRKQMKTNKVTYFNPPHNLWLPSANIPSFNYQRKIIWTFNSNSNNILKFNSSTLVYISIVYMYLLIY
ncbi:unnamed protein product [Schistosoma rodhaini]|nr:unnamed protein product [Schistosoma rodhaini]